MILPLRYAAVVGENAKQKDMVPPMPADLATHFADIPLEKSVYAPRFVRQGFIYVLIDRTTDKGTSSYWEAYQTTDDGYLCKFAAEKPPSIAAEFSCYESECTNNASMIAITKVAQVNKIYIMFAPSALSASKLTEYKKNVESCVAKGQLQVFDPKGWAAGKYKQPHSMTPDLLKKHVPEYVLLQQLDEAFVSNRGIMLREQLYPAMMDSFRGRKPIGGKPFVNRLGNLFTEIERTKAAVLVMYDHIGITQELNQFRNDAGEAMREYLIKTDRNQVSNVRKYNIMQAIEDTKSGYISQSIGTKERYLGWALRRHDVVGLVKQREIWAKEGNRQDLVDRYQRRIESAVDDNAFRAKQFVRTPAEAASDWNEEYEGLLDIGEMSRLKTEIPSIADACRKKEASRFKDHVKWVTSERLVNAYDMYDVDNPGSGFCFTAEHMICTDGMFGAPENLPLLKKWLGDAAIAHNNLYMRANFFNQKDLQAAARASFAEAKELADGVPSLSNIASAPWLKAAIKLIDVHKKYDSAWDEWLRDKPSLAEQKYNADPIKNPKPARLDVGIKNLSKFHTSTEGRFCRMIATYTQAFSSKPGSLDKLIGALVTMLVFSKLGEHSKKIKLEQYYKVLRPEFIKTLKEKQTHANDRKLIKHKNTAMELIMAEKMAAENAVVDLLHHEETVMTREMKKTLDELELGDRNATNNFRQARMACLLLSMESFALTLKLTQDTYSPRLKVEIAGNLFSVFSMFIDIVYSVTKAPRELWEEAAKASGNPALGMATSSKKLDITRGGLKILSGTSSCLTGVISAVLDFWSLGEEATKKRPDKFLMLVYGGRGITGFTSTIYGTLAAYSYAASYLTSISASGARRLGIKAADLVKGAAIAGELAKSRTLWLIRLARFNAIGLGFTIAEIVYHVWFEDDELQAWLKDCSLAKGKRWKPDISEAQELKNLDKAFKTVIP